MIVSDRMGFAEIDYLGQTTMARRGAGNMFGPGHFSASAFVTGRPGMYDPEGEDDFLAPGGGASEKGTTMIRTALPESAGAVAPGVRVRRKGAGAPGQAKKIQASPVAPVAGIM